MLQFLSGLALALLIACLATGFVIGVTIAQQLLVGGC